MGYDEADQTINPLLQDAANIVLVVCPADAENGAPLKLVVVLSMSGLCSTASSRLNRPEFAETEGGGAKCQQYRGLGLHISTERHSGNRDGSAAAVYRHAGGCVQLCHVTCRWRRRHFAGAVGTAAGAALLREGVWSIVRGGGRLRRHARPRGAAVKPGRCGQQVRRTCGVWTWGGCGVRLLQRCES